MDYAELTTVAYGSQIPINDLLMKLSRIFSNDMSFNSLRIRRNQVNLSGTCSSLNGNYSFYTFLQKLQSISYLDKPRYSLSLAPGVNVSKFSVQIDWRKSE